MAAFVIALFAFFLHAVVESWCLISATSSSRWSTSPHGGGLLSTQPIIASAITTAEKSNAKGRKSGLVLASTPFEANLFGSDEPCEDDESTSPASNPYNPDVESLSQEYLPLAVSPDTRLVLGLNKYSHDTALVAADSRTGKVLFGMSKERLTRRKHDGGNAALLVETCLDQLNLTLLSVDLVVMNNHHHRILPLENNRAHLEWELGLGINGGSEPGYDEPENLFYYDAEEGNSNVIRRHELSHHLAHAYSTVAQAPFESGLCLVADGMGESYRTMLGAKLAKDTSYTSDLLFEGWTCVPSDLPSLSVTHPYDYREAESLYTFAKVGNHSLELRPIWKRFTCENTPPTLYNHGFENMDSLGAVYSRASSTIFGDWNACGKVMGLAPWAFHSWTELETASASEETVAIGTTVQSGRPRGRSPLRQTTSSSSHSVRKARLLENPVFLGSLTDECGFRIDRSIMQGEPLFSRNDPDLFEEDYDGMDGSRLKLRPRYDFDDNDSIAHGGASRTATVSSPGRSPKRVALDAIALAHRVQIDLEASLLDLVGRFKGNHTNLCLAGGVALNSVANGRLSRELGLERTFVSPYPGDDGIAVGCCAFGLFGNAYLGKRNNIILEEEPPTASSYVTGNTNRKPMLWKQPLSPYLGPAYSELDLVEAIEQARPWIEVETIRDNDRRLQLMAEEIESGGVVAWFHSRSEIGPRALGHRSILADPRKKGLVRFINEHVKSRESFRPFAPSVLAEEAASWFELGDFSELVASNVSPFMSLTAMVRPEKRALIPAVSHVDGSSRLQTVTRLAEPLYYKLIHEFFALTGVPLVLNTSFNTLPREPIVESPRDAIRSFLYSMGSIEMLVLDHHVIRRKKPDVRLLLGEATKQGDYKLEPARPKRTGRAEFMSTFELDDGLTAGQNSEVIDVDVHTRTKVRMPIRPMHATGKTEWFELLDELEGELLSVCDGTVTLNDIMVQYTADSPDERPDEERVEDAQVLLQNIVHRLVRLFENTLISW